jgi:RNA polymerase sigma-70 factor, ECF subfamily
MQATDTILQPAVVETDEEPQLVLAAQRGDASCFEALVSRYERRIFRLAKNVVRDDSDAEEVMQDLLKAFEHIGDFKGNSRFYTWLVRITINQALMKLRKRRPNHVSLDAPPIETEEGSLPRDVKDWGPTPEEHYSQKELAEILTEAIAALTPALRIVLHLRDVENVSTEETAKLTGLSVPAVKTRLLRARLQLRENLNRFFRKDNRYPTAFPRSVAETDGILRHQVA